MRLISFAFFVVTCSAQAQTAYAGCQISLSVRNTSNIDIQLYPYRSKVKSRGGSWRKLGNGGWKQVHNMLTINPSSTEVDTYSAAFRCNARRRYLIQYACKTASVEEIRTVYFPDPNGWSDDQSPVIRLNCS
ncbi:MAG: hypothetical protein AAF441_03995 [Pseudomonadota bacterium]